MKNKKMTAKEFKKLRLKAKLTQKKLANMMGKTSREISRYENGVVEIPTIVGYFMMHHA